MSIDKSTREKLKKILAIIIILVVAWMWGKILSEILPQHETTEESSIEEPNAEGTLLLTMIDVGQGDSFLFVQGDKVALIDCGTRSTGKDVVKYLKERGISKIDYLFGTHPHDDHMGGMYDVITNFEISKIILPEVKDEITTNWYLKLMQQIKTGGYKLEYSKVGTVYKLGDASIKVIGPISQPKDNLNNYSIVLKVSFGEMDAIMAGDAEKTVEADILKSGEILDAEILKVGHHGSDTSSSKEFLDAISPEYALISCKIGNTYNHPIKETMENLKQGKVKVYRTDEQGTVIVTITANSITFNCNPADYLSGPELAERETK